MDFDTAEEKGPRIAWVDGDGNDRLTDVMDTREAARVLAWLVRSHPQAQPRAVTPKAKRKVQKKVAA